MTTGAPSEVLERNEQLRLDAGSLGIKGIGHLKADASWPETKVQEANDKLSEKIRAHGDAQQAGVQF